MKGRTLIGRPSGSGFQDLSAIANPHVTEGGHLDAFLNQDYMAIKVTSPFGQWSFDRTATDDVVDGLKALADMIERSVVR